ncbi:hypothetical protein E4T39_01672 [Aureobasidium subglaciale]|nr:hypothetical protein E4T39_01672 [Aureobasidium subglaciale]
MLHVYAVLVALTIHLSAVRCHTGKLVASPIQTCFLRPIKSSHILHGGVTILSPMALSQNTILPPRERTSSMGNTHFHMASSGCILVEYRSGVDNIRPQCADVTLADPVDVPEVNASNCFNSSDLSFQLVYATGNLTSGALPIAVPFSPMSVTLPALVAIAAFVLW